MHSSTSDREKFAIIGIGCRMPPTAGSLEAFWKFLLRGGNALKPVRKDRWDWRQFFDEDPKRPGKTYAPKFAMLETDVKLFDPLVFGITPREAACMDPQQRLLLEVTWEALEDAGISREKVAGSLTGVFIGGFCMDHLLHQMQPSNRHLIGAHSPVGASMTLLSNRLSHAFDLRGPSLTMDTACSSSLVAIHYACQSLRLREADMVVAGGVNVMTRPDFPIMMSKGHFLSDHGECHTFDISASGYARGEGAGVFLIKRLGDAIANRDPIHAVICGTGVNQDGHTDGISLPNSDAQETLARSVYVKNGLVPGEVDYLEAHGTGTQAGDPAESRALDAVFSEGRKRPLPVGSVKTNVGHMEAAAGVAGMLKTIGVLKYRQIPRNLHFKTPNPKIPFEKYCLEVVQETTPLPPPEEKPTVYAAVNSFGYGGTNAHIVLESAPPVEALSSAEPSHRPFLVPLSANSEKALRDLAAKFAFQAGRDTPDSILDLAFTTAFHRSHLDFRCVSVANDLAALREQWIAASTGQMHDGLVSGSVSNGVGAGLVFVFTGMGPQWWGMGQELMRSEPVFAGAVEEIDVHFKALSGWSLRDAMMSGEAESRMARTEVAQPANFAIQVGLTRLWESMGLRPAAVVGHSVGEVVSAYIAGVYSLEDAVRVSFHRSRLQQTMAGRGAMLAVGLPEAEALKWIEDSPGVSIAAVNSFSAVTLSGDADQLHSIAAVLEKKEIFQKFLRVEVAYHSPQMDPLHGELSEVLAELAPHEETIPLYSTAHGKRIPSAGWNAEYWWQNVRQPVHFAAAMQALFEDGYTHFLEIGPHPVLGNSIKECAVHLEKNVTCFTSLRRKDPEMRQILLTAAGLYCAGFDLDWAELVPGGGKFIPTPKYPWQRELHWSESDRSKMDRLGLSGPVYLNRTLLGGTPSWEVEINRHYFPFLMDHGVQDQTIFAGMGYIEAALSLAAKVYDKPAVVLENVSFEKVLVVDPSKLQYLVTGFEPGEGRFSIHCRVEGEEDSVQRHARGRMVPLSDPPCGILDLQKLAKECPVRVDTEPFYERLAKRSLHYGPEFRRHMEILTGEDCFLVHISAAGDASHILHPTISDAAIQPILFRAGGERLFVPFSIGRFEFFSTPESDCYAFGRLTFQSDFRIAADVWLTDPAGKVHARLHDVLLQSVDIEEKQVTRNLVFHPEWNPAPLENIGDTSNGTKAIIFADEEDSDMELAAQLSKLLPGAVLEAGGSSGRNEGFGREAFASRLASYSTNPEIHLIVLWGSKLRTSALAEESALALNAKTVGLLQAAGGIPATNWDLTFVTRHAKAVLDTDNLNNPEAGTLSAIGLVAQNECGNIMCRSLDFDNGTPEQISLLIDAEMTAGSCGDIAFREGQRFEWSLVPGTKTEDVSFSKECLETPVVLCQGTKGRLDSLVWEYAERIPPGEGEIEIRIHSTSLNYKDVLKLEGRLHPVALENTFWGTSPGMECSGTVIRSGPGSTFAPEDRVVAILQEGFRNYATMPEIRALRIPGNLGMEAAAIPVAYLTAYRGLVDIAHLCSGERVLIHNATDDLGLAAIDIAKWIGAKIFATADSAEKQEFLRELGIDRIFSSLGLDFGRCILQATNEEGVDVVIGAPAGHAVHVSLGLLRSGGRYVEVGKKDISEDNSLPMRAFNRNLIFASLDIDRLAQEQPVLIRSTLVKILERFEAGDFHLDRMTFFPPSKIRDAFGQMAGNRPVGKFLVDLSEGEVDVVRRPESKAVVKPDGCYIVTGGTSGFGLVSACWLAAQGAGKVILVSRSGKNAPGIGESVRQMESLGTEVDVRSVDMTDAGAVRTLIEEAGGSRFALKGILHGAMVLDDAMMEDLTGESFRKVFLPKAVGGIHLASALADLKGLDFLVFYSSISSLIGNRGQTSYVAANALLDALALSLRAKGIPATSINWGALAEAGVVARDERLGSILSSAGITGLTNQEAVLALENAIRSARPQVGVFSVDWKSWHGAHPKLADDPRFRELRSDSLEEGADKQLSEFRQSLSGLSKEQRLRVLEEQLQDVLAVTLKMSKETVSLTRKLNEIGVDSLMVLELSLGIKERIGVLFSAMEFLKGPTLQQLAALAEKRL